MRNVDYSIRVELPGTPYDDAVRRVTDELAAEGFGILTEIDVRATLKEKLDVEFHPYVILGACNPGLAHEALTTDDNIGLLLPCNVVVAARDGGSEVGIASPRAMLDVAGNPEVRPVADRAEEALRRVASRLAA